MGSPTWLSPLEGKILDLDPAARSVWNQIRTREILQINPWQDLPSNAHKYTRGHILVIGGSEGKTGAPVLAGLAALRTGAGWASIAIPKGTIPVDRPVPWELTIESFFSGNSLDASAMAEFIQTRSVQAIVIGPGWMTQHLSEQAWDVLSKAANQGVGIVIDAGALHGILDMIESSATPLDSKARVILTPHPGEWRFLRHEKDAFPTPLSMDGKTAVQETCGKLHICLVYKGATPAICTTDQAVIVTAGSNILARAGTGDVTAGVIAAHLARGTDAAFAASRGFTLVSEAAKTASLLVGRDAVLASDIISALGIAGSALDKQE